ncbi:MAG TPA: DUF2953 domain-containing protein [Bacillota bacterium]|nr:DUF2953 domain-containing protein [Bacillota bacterium]
MAWILIGLAMVITLFLFSHMEAVFHYTYAEGKQRLLMHIYYCRIRLLKKEINLEQHAHPSICRLLQEKNLPKHITHVIETMKDSRQKISEVYEVFTTILNKIRFKQITWSTDVGIGDASTTGVVTGGIWAIKSIIFKVLQEKTHFQKHPVLRVSPHFQSTVIKTDVECMISIRIGQAIYALFTLGRRFSIKEITA